VAMAAAGAALVLELWWSVARLSRGRIKHPVIRKFDPEERAAPSRLATAAILDADRRGAAGLDFPALGLPPDDSALIREIRQLQGAATPHFAPILLDRLRALAQRLPPDDAVRLATDREIAALERLHEAGTIASLDGDAGVKPP